MLSRLLDPRDGKPRNPVFWLVVAAIAASQLLAFYVLCTNQVRKAEHRRAVVQQVAADCAVDCAAAGRSSTQVAFSPDSGIR